MSNQSIHATIAESFLGMKASYALTRANETCPESERLQDWETGTTTYSFEDGSRLRICGPVVFIACECGAVFGERCDYLDPADVVVWWMPEHLRASHEAAGHRGASRANGSKRLRCCTECADRIVEAEGDWASIV